MYRTAGIKHRGSARELEKDIDINTEDSRILSTPVLNFELKVRMHEISSPFVEKSLECSKNYNIFFKKYFLLLFL